MNLFFIYFFLVFVLALIFVLFLLMRAMFAQEGAVSRSLNMELVTVRFPPVLQPENEMRILREKISAMEQFFSHMSSLRDTWWNNFRYGPPYFALELAVPHVGDEIFFYVAVPRRLIGVVQKIINGIFPEAQMEIVRDYNIFNPEGESAGAEIAFTRNSFYPIRTYQKIEGDPVKTLTNVFSKINFSGEGSALQIVARPAAEKWRRKLKERAFKMYQGKHMSDNPLAKTMDALSSVTRSAADPQKPQEQHRLTPAQEEAVRALEAKAGKALFETSIRVMASAPTQERADEILSGFETAFAQFDDPQLNTFKFQKVSGGAFKKLALRFSFRTINESTKCVLASDELTSLYHFPNVLIDTPKVKLAKSREAPPPSTMPSEGLLLGYSPFRGQEVPVRLSDDDRRRHLYIIGQTGTGKSVFLKNLIIQDIQEGKGVCVIDPHGELVGDVLEFVPRHRMQDVIYFDPGDTERPMGINMLEYDPAFPEHKTLIVNELFSIFDKLFNMSIAGGPIFEQYFRNSTMLVLEDPASGNTILEIQRVLSDKDYRDLKLSRSRNIVVNQFWTQIAEKAGGEASLKDMVPYISSKIDNFISNEIMRPIVAQEKSAFNFREVMDNQKILLVNLSKGRLGDLNSSFIGLILVGKLLMAALSRVDMDMEKRRDFYLYIDEFQNVTTDSIATILSEARKYRLDLIITHQFIGQLKEEIKKAVFGNVGSMVTFRIGTEDAEFMAKQYKPTFVEHDLLNLDNYNAYVKLLIKGQTSPPFNMRTYPPGIGTPEIAQIAKEISRTKYGRPRDEVEKEIIERFSAMQQ